MIGSNVIQLLYSLLLPLYDLYDITINAVDHV